MIKKIYFWDGLLTGVSQTIPEVQLISVVDGQYGYTINCEMLEYYQHNTTKEYIILTNQIAALNFRWFDYEGILNTSNKICLYNKQSCRWEPIEARINQELHFGHNLEQMYRNGVFFEEGE